MSAPHTSIPSSTPPPLNVAATVPSSADPSTAGAIATTSASPQLNSATTVSSMADLKKKAPHLYNAMMQGIGMNICNEMKAHQDRLKRLMDEGMRH